MHYLQFTNRYKVRLLAGKYGNHIFKVFLTLLFLVNFTTTSNCYSQTTQKQLKKINTELEKIKNDIEDIRPTKDALHKIEEKTDTLSNKSDSRYTELSKSIKNISDSIIYFRNFFNSYISNNSDTNISYQKMVKGISDSFRTLQKTIQIKLDSINKNIINDRNSIHWVSSTDVWLVIGGVAALVTFIFLLRLIRYFIKIKQHRLDQEYAFELMERYTYLKIEQALIIATTNSIDFNIPKVPIDNLVDYFKTTHPNTTPKSVNSCCCCCKCFYGKCNENKEKNKEKDIG